MRVAIMTLGCRVNVYESEAMLEKFVREGYEVVDFEEQSDVYVVNTCTVTNMGDKKSRQLIRRAKKNNPEAVLAVVGCYSQVAPEEIQELEGVDVILGTRNKGDVVYWVHRAQEEEGQIVKVGDVLRNKEFEELNIEEYKDKTRAFLKIQDGCNRFCSYCMIPYARGAVCSKGFDKILEEVNQLAGSGFKEIILSGIHIASYGVDLKENVDLVSVIKEIEKVDGIERVRIGSIDPDFFTDDVIKELSSCKKLMPHFHLSLQSGCNETLKRMNRRYTAEDYKSVVDKLRVAMKDVSITTDVIVGFPGETEEEFEATYKFMEDIKLAKVHVFKYSPRKGTKAADMKDQVNPQVKEARSKRLIELASNNEKLFMEEYIGSKMNVLFEDESSSESGMYEGYTENYIRVTAKADNSIKGNIKSVKIKDINRESLKGEIL